MNTIGHFGEHIALFGSAPARRTAILSNTQPVIGGA